MPLRSGADHKHEWQPTYKPAWPYACPICGGKSRNPGSQHEKYREPLRITSLYWDFTTGQQSVTQWTPGEEPTA